MRTFVVLCSVLQSWANPTQTLLRWVIFARFRPGEGEQFVFTVPYHGGVDIIVLAHADFIRRHIRKHALQDSANTVKAGEVDNWRACQEARSSVSSTGRYAPDLCMISSALDVTITGFRPSSSNSLRFLSRLANG